MSSSMHGTNGHYHHWIRLASHPQPRLVLTDFVAVISRTIHDLRGDTYQKLSVSEPVDQPTLEQATRCTLTIVPQSILCLAISDGTIRIRQPQGVGIGKFAQWLAVLSKGGRNHRAASCHDKAPHLH